MQQTGIFIVEDSEDKPDSFWNRFTSLIRPTAGSPGEPPMGVVCYETTSYKRQNLLETLRPSGVDSPVLRAIQSVLKKGGMVAGNAAIMVSYFLPNYLGDLIV
jgi:cyanophycinase